MFYCLWLHITPSFDDKTPMKAIKHKFNNIQIEELKSIFKCTRLLLSLRQLKNLYWELVSSKFTSDNETTRNLGTFKCYNKRRKIFQP